MSRNTSSALLSAWAAITLLLAASCSRQPATPVQTADTGVQQLAAPEVTEPVEEVEPAEIAPDVTGAPAELEQPSDVPLADPAEMLPDPLADLFAKDDPPSIDLDSIDDPFFGDAPAELEQPSDEPLADPAEMLPDPLADRFAKDDLPSIDLASIDDLFFGLEKEATPEPVEEEPRRPDVVFVPTPQKVVDRMLELAQVTKDDLVYDLGCGDGRIVATAAKRYGARAKGFDIDPQRVKDSLATVKEHGVEHLVEIHEADIFTLDLSEASVITLYLLPNLNVRLIPQLEKLKPGSRIVSHAFDMRGVKPDKVETVEGELGSQHTVYLWTTPLNKYDAATPEDEYNAVTPEDEYNAVTSEDGY